MIQRIQTLFLLLACGLMAATAVLPLAEFSFAGEKFTLILSSCGVYSLGVKNIYPTWGVLAMAVISALLPLINIFFYKKRKLQIKIGHLTTFFILFFYVTAGVYFYTFVNKSGDFSTLSVEMVYALVLPAISLIFNALAIRRIKKDEKLVRSLDRIR